MRLASGWKWSRRRQRIEVFLAGQRIGWQTGAEAAHGGQARGEFRHRIASDLIQAGATVEAAARFACLPVRNAPEWRT